MLHPSQKMAYRSSRSFFYSKGKTWHLEALKRSALSYSEHQHQCRVKQCDCRAHNVVDEMSAGCAYLFRKKVMKEMQSQQ